jgi:hypothetical protein
MSEHVTITIHAIAEDGYPYMDGLIGRVAFIWDGYIVDGWPLHADPEDNSTPHTGTWEAADDKLSSVREFSGVTHWVEFPEPIWNYENAMSIASRPCRNVRTTGWRRTVSAVTRHLTRHAGRRRA